MTPAFARIVHHAPESSTVAMHAGPWEAAHGCHRIGTKTFCTLFVLWCVNRYFCPDQMEHTTTPYPCGLCFGITSPSDW